MSILNQIIEHKKQELETVMRSMPLAELKAKIGDMGSTRSFMKAIKRDKGGPIKLIAELKKASPEREVSGKTYTCPISYPFTTARVFQPYPFSQSSATSQANSIT